MRRALGRRYTPSMTGSAFRDPKVRQAYIMTKVVVFAVAALATWPLSRIIGPSAWWGLGIFGAVLFALGVVVLGMGGGQESSDQSDDTVEDEVGDPPGPVAIPIEDSIDLHPFPPKDIPAIVEDYLTAAHAEGFREVRLIHGRGIGVQRERVRTVLARDPRVVEFHDGTPDRGGWGATIAYLDGD